MSARNSKWYKLLALVILLVLIAPMLAACGDDDDEDKTPTATATQPTTSATATAPATTTVTGEPVKIGILSSYSGGMAAAGALVLDPTVSLIEWQLEKQGGIDVGGVLRPVKFIKVDDRSEVAGTVAGFTKLVTQDKVSIVAVGGFQTAQLNAASDEAEKLAEVPFFTISGSPQDLSDRPWTFRAAYAPFTTVYGKVVPDFVAEVIEPRTIGFLVSNEEEYRYWTDQWKPRLEADGVEIVYEQYFNLGVADFAPYLTNIRYEHPDLVVLWTSDLAALQSMHVQMAGLGGWEDMKTICPTAAGGTNQVVVVPAAEGSYSWMPWLPGIDNPGSRKFEQDSLEKNGKVDPVLFLPYCVLWSAIHAIEFAGSDDPAVIQKAARSGNFEWESPAGPLHLDTTGENSLMGIVAQNQQGKMVLVWNPD